MEEIDIKEIFNVLWNKIAYIILFTILFSVIGGYYTYFLLKPDYRASTTLVLVKTEEGTESQALTQADINLNQKLVSTYSEIIKSKKVAKQVIEELELDMTEGEFAKNITVAAVKNTELINLTVKNSAPEMSVNIANKISEVFSKEISEIYKMQNIVTIDEAELPTGPFNINHKKDIAIFATIGAVIAVAIIFVIHMFDTTIKTSEDVEKYLGLNVLSTVPVYKPNKGGHK